MEVDSPYHAHSSAPPHLAIDASDSGSNASSGSGAGRVAGVSSNVSAGGNGGDGPNGGGNEWSVGPSPVVDRESTVDYSGYRHSPTHSMEFAPSLSGPTTVAAAITGASYFAEQTSTASHSSLRKVLGPLELIALGVGCTIGAGIFVLTGEVAHNTTGPALFLSYIASGVACMFSALCYAEFAAMSPVAGSAYSYARATLGETMGWIIGWDLCLEYSVAAATVAQGWSKYFNQLVQICGSSGIPESILSAPWDYNETDGFYATGAVLNFPAICITMFLSLILVRGIRESARFNAGMVLIKVTIVLFVICVGSYYFNSNNFTPFAPYGYASFTIFGNVVLGQTGANGGPGGVFAGAAIVFFSYIGFDSVSCQAEETRNPQRDLPIGIIGSLVISTALYVAVSIVLCGMQSYTVIDVDAPMSKAFAAVGAGWAEGIVAVGAIVGITSVLLVTLLGQPRIFLAMSRDGLLPNEFFNDLHPKFGTPYKSTLLTGIFVSLFAAFMPLSFLVELVSIGTLFAFGLVCISVLILRRTAPTLHRPFLCPLVPFVPAFGALLCFILMLSLPGVNWVRLIVWLCIGLAIYLGFGKKNAAALRVKRAEERELDEEEDGEGNKNEDNRDSGSEEDEVDGRRGRKRRVASTQKGKTHRGPPESIQLARLHEMEHSMSDQFENQTDREAREEREQKQLCLPAEADPPEYDGKDTDQEDGQDEVGPKVVKRQQQRQTGENTAHQEKEQDGEDGDTEEDGTEAGTDSVVEPVAALSDVKLEVRAFDDRVSLSLGTSKSKSSQQAEPSLIDVNLDS